MNRGQGGSTTIEMVPTDLDKLDQLCQIFKAANPYSIIGDPTSTMTQRNKGKHVGIKKKKGVSYFQHEVKLAVAEVSLPQEPVADPLPQ